jgi:hypothetical protein
MRDASPTGRGCYPDLAPFFACQDQMDRAGGAALAGCATGQSGCRGIFFGDTGPRLLARTLDRSAFSAIVWSLPHSQARVELVRAQDVCVPSRIRVVRRQGAAPPLFSSDVDPRSCTFAKNASAACAETIGPADAAGGSAAGFGSASGLAGAGKSDWKGTTSSTLWMGPWP